jgi:hypothetical protein
LPSILRLRSLHLKLFFFFFKNEGQEDTTGLLWGLEAVGGDKIKRKHKGGSMWWKYYVLNRKTNPVETILRGEERGGWMQKDGRGEFN